MPSHAPPDAEAQARYRRVAHEVYQKLALGSFLVWTLGCLILFIVFAAGNPRPIPSAALAMTAPLVPAFLLWIFYRPLVRWRVNRLHAGTSEAARS